MARHESTRTRRSREQTCDPGAGSTLWAATGLLVTVFAFAALLTFSSQDWPNPHVYPHADPIDNACGRVGAWMSFQVIRLVGAGGYPLLLFAALALYWRLARGGMALFAQRAISAVVLATVLSTTVDVLYPDGERNLPFGYAGVIGAFLGRLLRDNFNPFGTFLILTYCALTALFFAVDGLGARVTAWAGGMGGSLLSAGQHSLARAVEASAGIREAMRSRAESIEPRQVAAAGLASASGSRADDPPMDKRARKRPAGEVEADEAPEAPSPVRARAQKKRPPAAPLQSEPQADPAPRPARRSRLKEVKDIVFRHHSADPMDKTGCYPAVLDDWVLPPVSLLGESAYHLSAKQETMAREKARILEETLADFRIEAPVVEIETGPVITMFELRLAPGIKVSQIGALSNDIARALKAPNVRVVAPIPGKNTVGIEVPRIDREKVRLRELMTTTGHKAKKMLLPLYLGKDASGSAMVFDLAKMPHMLIAGTTGSGKSVCINSIIMSILMTQRPDRVKLIMVDPKMVELSVFKEVPHLMCPIVTDMNKAEQILEWATSKMDERYSLLAEAGVRNIADYNKLSPEQIRERFNPANDEESQHIPPHLSYMVIVIDELADLMMTAAKEVEYHLARLAQKSRAVGIHIVVATQRPEAKVVTGLIKSNLPCRCAFRVAARMDSRIVLDQNGAEGLLGQGDMLFLPPGSANLERAQGTFIEDDELHATVKDLSSKGKCEYHPELMKIRTGPKAEVGERDELFEDAVHIILESQRGSVSLLQRRLTIGYSRASRLVDQMAEAGIVGDYKGSQAREVLMTLDEWNTLKQQVQQEMQEGYAADQDDPDPADEAGAGDTAGAFAAPDPQDSASVAPSAEFADVAETDDEETDDAAEDEKDDTEVGEHLAEDEADEDEQGEEEEVCEYEDDEEEDDEEEEDDDEDEDEEEVEEEEGGQEEQELAEYDDEDEEEDEDDEDEEEEDEEDDEDEDEDEDEEEEDEDDAQAEYQEKDDRSSNSNKDTCAS